MKTLAPALKTHIAGEVTALCTCWRVVRRDNVTFYFTDHDADLVIDGNTYVSAVGYDRTAMSADAALSVDNLEATGFFDAAELTSDDMRSGLFDFAEVHVFAVNWDDLSQGKMKLRRGYLGEVRSSPSGIFTTELRGLVQRLSAKVGDIYTPECRADLGDTKCKVDLTSFTFSETVTAVTDNANFIITNGNGAAVDGWYQYGTITWTSGNNDGRSIEVKGWSQGTAAVELLLSMPRNVQIGDTLNIVAGCDKRHDTCRDKFNNMVNRRAEDFIPGFDAIIQTPNAIVA